MNRFQFISFLTQSTPSYNYLLTEDTTYIQSNQNQSIPASQFEQLLDNIQHQDEVYIKVLQHHDNTLKVYNVQDQFHFASSENADIKIGFNPELTEWIPATNFINDFRAIHDWADTNASSVEGSDLIVANTHSINTKVTYSIYYDDRLNIIFLTIGLSRDEAESYIDSLITALQERIDNSDENTKVNLAPDGLQEIVDDFANLPVSLALLSPFCPRLAQQNHNAEAINQIDITDIEQEDVENQNDNDNNNQEVDAQNNEQPPQQVQNNLRTTTIAGQQFIGPLPDLNTEQATNSLSDADIIISNLSYTEFSQSLSNFPETMLTSLHGTKPVYYKQVVYDTTSKFAGVAKRVKFIKFTKENDRIIVKFLATRGKDNLLMKMPVDHTLFQEVVSVTDGSWIKRFNTIWARDYDRYLIDILWDPGNVREKMRHTGNRPGAEQRDNQQGQETTQNTQKKQQTQNQQQDQQTNQQRQGIKQRRQQQQQQQQQTIEGLTTQALNILHQHEATDVDIELVTTKLRRVGGIPRDNNKYFVIKFPGIDKTVLTDSAAISFLSSLDLWSGVIQPAFDYVKRTIQDIKLCITMNNKYYSEER